MLAGRCWTLAAWKYYIGHLTVYHQRLILLIRSSTEYSGWLQLLILSRQLEEKENRTCFRYYTAAN